MALRDNGDGTFSIYSTYSFEKEPMDKMTEQRIADTKKIMKKIQSDGLEDHIGLIEEALEWFLLDCLEEIDFERLKRNMFEPRKSRMYIQQ